MTITRIFQWLGNSRRTIEWVAAPVLLLLVTGVAALVYATGGIKFVYSHSMYLPILLAGFVYGLRGGILFGLLGALVLGPYMPINVLTGEMQQTANWLYRAGFFVLVGFVSGAASDSVRSYVRYLTWVSRHDAETRLPNRNALLNALAQRTHAKKDKASSLLVVVALANGNELRSAFGVEVIKEIASQSAARYLEAAKAPAHAYRVGTEQLALLIDLSGARPAEAVLADLGDSARQPFLFNGIPIHADAHIGYVTCATRVQAPEQYLQMAESALLDAQERERECVAYDPGSSAAARENLSILGELMKAAEAGQLEMHYQPKIDIASGRVLGAEALMRWTHPERGNIPPGVFIPRAEKSTLIHLIARFSLEQSIAQMVRWRHEGIQMPIAVNISPRNLLHPGFADLIAELCERFDVSGDALELEVTEGALMTDIDGAIRELARLSAAKITISIDDFGTGYSSLQYLHRLPISYIKIDQSFIRRMPDDVGALHIVEAAVTLAHNMGLKTIAEGVETQAMHDMLRDIGCDMAQGYLISKPLPQQAFADWFRQHHQAPLMAAPGQVSPDLGVAAPVQGAAWQP